MRQLKAIFGFSSNLPGENGKLSHRNENYCKEEEKPAWVWRRVARKSICCQGKGKSHSPHGLGNSHTQVSEEQFQDQLPHRWALGALKHSPNTKISFSLLIRCFLPGWKLNWRKETALSALSDQHHYVKPWGSMKKLTGRNKCFHPTWPECLALMLMGTPSAW